MDDQNGKITATLVCGILSIVFCETMIISIVLAIVAIVIGNESAVKQADDGRARAGVICGIVGLVLSVLIIVCFVLLVVGVVHWALVDGSSYQTIMNTTDALYSASIFPIR